MDTATRAGKGTATASLKELVQLAGLPAAAAGTVEITGADPIFPTRYKVVAPGAAVIAATGLAAAELWKLKTGRQQTVRVDGIEEWTIDEHGLIAASRGHYDAAEYARQLEHGVD